MGVGYLPCRFFFCILFADCRRCLWWCGFLCHLFPLTSIPFCLPRRLSLSLPPFLLSTDVHYFLLRLCLFVWFSGWAFSEGQVGTCMHRHASLCPTSPLPALLCSLCPWRSRRCDTRDEPHLFDLFLRPVSASYLLWSKWAGRVGAGAFSPTSCVVFVHGNG